MSEPVGLWRVFAWDPTLPVPAYVFQFSTGDLAKALEPLLRWREGGQQVQLEWQPAPTVEAGPDDYRIGTRHDELDWDSVPGH
jgi:hypothetical protein